MRTKLECVYTLGCVFYSRTVFKRLDPTDLFELFPAFTTWAQPPLACVVTSKM